MKIFSKFVELWNYCLFCPICQEPSRTISISIGPDEEWQLTEFQKIGSELKMFCYWILDTEDKDHSIKTKHSAIFTVDCDKNTYQLSVNSKDTAMAKTAPKSSAYIYLHAQCNGCDNTYLDTMDMDFDPETSAIYNFQIEREGAYILSEKDKFHISLQHDRNVMSVSRMFALSESIGGMKEEDKVIDLPLVNLDFSNAPKIVNKIKTLILFS